MSEKVRIPFTFVVRSVTWRPDGEDFPDEPVSTMPIGPHDDVLPIEDANLHPNSIIGELTETARQEYYEEKAEEAREARERAREAEAASWEPKPTPPGASRLMASLYGNLRQRKQAPAASGSASQADDAGDHGGDPRQMVGPVGAPAAPTGLATAPIYGEDVARQPSAVIDAPVTEAGSSPHHHRAQRHRRAPQPLRSRLMVVIRGWPASSVRHRRSQADLQPVTSSQSPWHVWQPSRRPHPREQTCRKRLFWMTTDTLC